MPIMDAISNHPKHSLGRHNGSVGIIILEDVPSVNLLVHRSARVDREVSRRDNRSALRFPYQLSFRVKPE